MFFATPIKNRHSSFTEILIGFLGRDEASFVKTNHYLPILFFFHFFTIWLKLGQNIFCFRTKCMGFNQGKIKMGLSGRLWLGLALRKRLWMIFTQSQSQ
jgi:hypothetical protein